MKSGEVGKDSGTHLVKTRRKRVLIMTQERKLKTKQVRKL
jgi:hypothetical protein